MKRQKFHPDLNLKKQSERAAEEPGSRSRFSKIPPGSEEDW